MFPDSQELDKQWPPEYFAALARHLQAEYGYGVVICGHARNRELGESIRYRADASRVLNLMGETRLDEVFEIIGRSEAVFCNDSFSLHAANAMARPVVCFNQKLFYGRFLPYPDSFRRGPHLYLFTDEVGEPMSTLSPERVLPSVDAFLQEVAPRMLTVC